MIIRTKKEERAINDFYVTDSFIWKKGYKGYPFIDWIN